MVMVKRCSDEMEANVVRTQLEAAGIRAHVTGNLDICHTITAGVLVNVAESDLQEARQVLGLPTTEYTCPECGSHEVSMRLLGHPQLLMVILDRLGLRPLRGQCRCRVCRQRWVVHAP